MKHYTNPSESYRLDRISAVEPDLKNPYDLSCLFSKRKLRLVKMKGHFWQLNASPSVRV